MAWISLLAPIILEVLKFLLSGSSSSEKEKAAKELLAKIKAINAALKKVEDTDGDTSDLEDIINKR